MYLRSRPIRSPDPIQDPGSRITAWGQERRFGPRPPTVRSTLRRHFAMLPRCYAAANRGFGPIGDIETNSACANIAGSQLLESCLLQAQYGKRYCALRTVFPSVT
jgi:hypothetical protein